MWTYNHVLKLNTSSVISPHLKDISIKANITQTQMINYREILWCDHYKGEWKEWFEECQVWLRLFKIKNKIKLRIIKLNGIVHLVFVGLGGEGAYWRQRDVYHAFR